MNPLLVSVICVLSLLSANREPQGEGNRLVGYSGRCVGDDEVAVRQEAEQKAEVALVRELARFLEERTGRKLPPRSLWREYYWLRGRPGVTSRPELKVQTKDYGTLVEAWYELRIPPEILPIWLDRVENLNRQWMSWRLITAGGTIGGWLLAIGAMVILDRWTLGYRRVPIVVTCLGLAVFGTAAAWWWLLENRY